MFANSHSHKKITPTFFLRDNSFFHTDCLFYILIVVLYSTSQCIYCIAPVIFIIILNAYEAVPLTEH